jgi:putative transposase
MALDQSALLELLGELKLTDVTDRIRVATETLYQELINAEATALIGAAPFERSSTRTTQRNGSRPRTLSTTAGDLELRIPKLRQGTFFPSLLERRRRIDQALFAVVMEAYLHGVSTRKVDDLVKALGADTGISKSEVSQDLRRPGRRGRRVPRPRLADDQLPVCVPRRDLLQSPSQSPGGVAGHRRRGRRRRRRTPRGARLRRRRHRGREPFWTSFLRGLKARGLAGVQLVISDAHTGLKQAIAPCLIGSAWQRCRVHFMRNVLAVVPKANGEMVAAIIRTIFAQPDAGACLRPSSTNRPHARPVAPEGRRDALATQGRPARVHGFPQALATDLVHEPPRAGQQGDQAPHRRGRRVPQPRRAAAPGRRVLVEQHDEWEAADRRYFSEHSMRQLDAMNTAHIEEVVIPEIAAA